MNAKNEKYIGKTLEELESIFDCSAKWIYKNQYEIIMKTYFFGLFQKKLYVKCYNNGVVWDFYSRTDIM
ncbi:hypothetical protein ACFO4P_07610 [Epilithonimonas pallida]|uniref:Uncharacterized protein n=1 Tax=Epilithonimonas pallida TaxID=373671 RepID=A0ABY1R7I1_9FLAO|nr:hypothetical protein [Epilithonimonas pallida]SMP94188.1 hypothetical protein SAMN05421679_105270 [Epilithonimonas pallida]